MLRGSAFVGKIVDFIVKIVSSEVFEYGKIMKGYYDDMKEIKMLIKEFSASKNANLLVIFRKLQSVWCNYVNSGYGVCFDFLREVHIVTGKQIGRAHV